MKFVIVLAVTLQVFLTQDAIAQPLPKCVSSYPQNIVETQTVTQYGGSPVIQTIETLQGPFQQYLPSQQVTTVLQNQPQLTSYLPNSQQIITQPQFSKSSQIIDFPSQIIDLPPQFIDYPGYPPQIINPPPQIINPLPQIINPPQIITNQPQILSLPQQLPQSVFLPEPTILPSQTQFLSNNGLNLPQITNVLPGTTTIIQDSSVSNNLANALQLLVVSNLLSNTLPLNAAEEIIIPSLPPQIVQPYPSYGCSCQQGYVY